MTSLGSNVVSSMPGGGSVASRHLHNLTKYPARLMQLHLSDVVWIQCLDSVSQASLPKQMFFCPTHWFSVSDEVPVMLYDFALSGIDTTGPDAWHISDQVPTV